MAFRGRRTFRKVKARVCLVGLTSNVADNNPVGEEILVEEETSIPLTILVKEEVSVPIVERPCH